MLVLPRLSSAADWQRALNSVKSDFVNKKLVFYDGHPQKGVDRFIDYLLLDEDFSVLAIIEAHTVDLVKEEIPIFF
jgi:hypothetical protein